MAVDMEACMKAGTPAAHHKKLEPFVGTWKANVKHWMEPGTDPTESTGIMVNSWALGQRFLRQDYKSDPGGPPFEGAGYWGYNNVTGCYEGFWIDSMSTGFSTEIGSCDDAATCWTMTGELEFPVAGSVMQRRSVITIKDPDRHVMEMFMTSPGAPEFKVMEIEYTRA